MKNAIQFRLSGRFGHFLKAEAGTSALSYPVPTRTVLLGIVGAVLGLEKDTPQELLEPVQFAISGKSPKTHWHKAKFRKDPPTPLQHIIKRTQKQDANTKLEQATLIVQEWLINPCYNVWAILPDNYHVEFEERIKDRRWHFQPCLGVSEMLAEIEYIDTEPVQKLDPAVYAVSNVIRQKQANINFQELYDNSLTIQLLRMPRTVTPNRIFTHDNYLFEANARPIMIRTSDAYKIGKRVVMFL
ncbi:CRISPR-associated protein Cas5 [Desulforamulus ruminis]|uniref:CRISPR-associated protein Cas5 n=1 Tax=Desulforamulus ruminis (strain ATCC 23193 / DSM 2154 / NCIMB 8452 / DL) TaxID=696281 RepID=F6DTN7_DESRL|nr:CRISPR-associated protein Cas5 [Desulforamulus ruminis]AEG61211.1 CRISPR-associated protein Cas5 [Desulforamulus ruminis DSM 2154]